MLCDCGLFGLSSECRRRFRDVIEREDDLFGGRPARPRGRGGGVVAGDLGGRAAGAGRASFGGHNLPFPRGRLVRRMSRSTTPDREQFASESIYKPAGEPLSNKRKKNNLKCNIHSVSCE